MLCGNTKYYLRHISVEEILALERGKVLGQSKPQKLKMCFSLKMSSKFFRPRILRHGLSIQKM